jgi:hypothetical protein
MEGLWAQASGAPVAFAVCAVRDPCVRKPGRRAHHITTPADSLPSPGLGSHWALVSKAILELVLALNDQLTTDLGESPAEVRLTQSR